MSEYWVSRKKYFCQYCEIYIADDAPSRSQHENGLRHKGNKDRFVRGLYKAGIKKRQESEEETRQMKRVEETALAAYARDIGAGLEKPGTSPSTSAASVTVSKPKPPPIKPSDPYANYTTAASLGFTDPDVEHLVAQAAARKSEGRVGEWVAVVPPPPPLPPNDEASVIDSVKTEPGPSAGEVRRREEEPINHEEARHFKLRKKTASVGLGEIYDPGIIQIKPRVDSKAKVQVELTPGPTLGDTITQGDAKHSDVDVGPKATVKPTWTRRGWKWKGDEHRLEDPSQRDNVDKPSEDSLQGSVGSQDDAAVADKSENNIGGTRADSLQGAVAVPDEAAVAVKPEYDIDDSRAESTATAPEATPIAFKSEKDDVQMQLGPNSNAMKNEGQADHRISSGEATGGNLFRKRKAPGSTATRGRRQF